MGIFADGLIDIEFHLLLSLDSTESIQRDIQGVADARCLNDRQGRRQVCQFTFDILYHTFIYKKNTNLKIKRAFLIFIVS